jgi:Na+-transporting NADH:ubiquinone oxidoreductase subunit C
MKSEFAFAALPISALVAPSAFAVQYLTVDQAQKEIFPGKSFAAVPVKLTSAQRTAIERASGVRVLRNEQNIWRVSGGSWFIVDEVVGKHEFITYALGLNPDGSVKQIEIMDYRETYGAKSGIQHGARSLPARRANRSSSSTATLRTSAAPP